MEVLIILVLYAVFGFLKWAAESNKERRPRAPLPPRRPRGHPLDSLAGQLTRGDVVESGFQERTVAGRRRGHAVAVVARRPYQTSEPIEWQAAVSKRVSMHLMASPGRESDGKGYFQQFVRDEVVATSATVLADERVQRQLRILFNRGIEEIRFEDGWIKALDRNAGAYACRNHTATLKVLDRLIALSRAAEEALTKTTIKATVRYTQREGETCPYCRDDLGAELELVSCARCKTIHHSECFSELGHCTAMGCQSQRTRPVLQKQEGILEPFEISLASCELCGAPMAGAIEAVCTSERCGASLSDQRRHGRDEALNRARARREQRSEIRLRPPSARLEPPPTRRQRRVPE